MSASSTSIKCVRALIFAAALFSLILFAPDRAASQGKKPISKEGLVQSLKINGLSTQELVAQIQTRGVAFQLTSQSEAELRSAGARPEIIEAVRANYRPAAAAPTNPNAGRTPSTTKPSANVPAGPPLSKNEIVTLLQNGVTPVRVEQLVEVRGVTFSLTPDVAREITAAGGNRSLLGAITEKASSPTNAVSSSPPASTAPDYDDYTDQAVASIQASNAPGAIRYLQQAIQLDASKPLAYQLLGIAQLYMNNDIISAERSMRAAIERGGAAVFRVYHDHDGFFNTYCQGSLFVTRGDVTFKADDGNHTFEATDPIIKEVKLNGFVGSQYAAFHLKVLRENNKSKTYNFAPATTKKPESNLIINLVQGYR
jgi:hypothetical protein